MQKKQELHESMQILLDLGKSMQNILFPFYKTGALILIDIVEEARLNIDYKYT